MKISMSTDESGPEIRKILKQNQALKSVRKSQFEFQNKIEIDIE